MDPKLVADIRQAHEASMMLLTLLLEGNDDVAADLCYNDTQYRKSATCMSLAVLASSAMRTLAMVLDEDPMNVISSTGLSVAQNIVNLEQTEEE